MTLTTKNIIANFAGSGWSALMSLAFIPMYISLMGAEAYGIIGVFVSMQAIFAILDLGLSQTLNREMARLSVNPLNAKIMADTARTLEVIYWGVALGLILLLVLLSNFLAFHWLNPVQLSRKSLVEALWVMAFVLGLRWPVNLYMGGLNGLQRQVAVNLIITIFVTLQSIGALAVLLFYEPTVRAFFLWQALIALFQALTFYIVFWNSFSNEKKGVFRKELLKGIWHFAAGMTGISLLGTILTQLDKILLSRLLPLSEFGYYSFAAAVAAVLYKLIYPIFTAYFPRFTVLASKDNQSVLAKTYHQACQFMTITILPLSLTIAFFSKEILSLWSRNPDVVKHSYILVSMLVIGNALHGLYYLPYALQLANNWTQLAFYQNVIAVIILAPAIYFSTLFWGSIGAAGVWILLNIGYLTISVQVMHRQLLKKEKWRWYANDIGKPLIIILLIVYAGRSFMNETWQNSWTILLLTLTLIVSTVAALWSSNSLKFLFSFALRGHDKWLKH
jgi:O-antigen/teichoic acid export membrane protein